MKPQIDVDGGSREPVMSNLLILARAELLRVRPVDVQVAGGVWCDLRRFMRLIFG